MWTTPEGRGADRGRVAPADPPLDLDYALHFSSRLDAYQSIMGSKILALFLGLYLGFTFLLAAAAVLALQQLSQAADNQKRYAMLRRLGGGRRPHRPARPPSRWLWPS